jgi:hypothetical protein
MSKRSHKPKVGNKIRMSLTLDPDAVRMGEAIAKEDRRSLSNLIEVLFEQERERRVKEIEAA